MGKVGHMESNDETTKRNFNAGRNQRCWNFKITKLVFDATKKAADGIRII